MKRNRQKKNIIKPAAGLFLLLCLLLWGLSVSASEFGREYIGYRHKGVIYGSKLPNGVKDLGGGLLSDDSYGVTRFTKGRYYMLWLEKIIDYDKNSVPNWEVKDVLTFQNLKKNQEFLFSYSSPCTLDGAENLDLIVMAEKQKKTYRVLKAWLANIETERFEQTSTKGIVCGFSEADELNSGD